MSTSFLDRIRCSAFPQVSSESLQHASLEWFESSHVALFEHVQEQPKHHRCLSLWYSIIAGRALRAFRAPSAGPASAPSCWGEVYADGGADMACQSAEGTE